jgi:hypothetical protein
MRLKSSVCSLALLCLTATVVAQTAPTAPATSTAAAPSSTQDKDQAIKRAEIRRLIELTGAAKESVDVIRQMIAPIRASFPNVPEQFWDDFLKQVNADDLIDLVVPVYDKYYSLQDIHDLIGFYQSPVGQKTIKVLPQLSAETISAGQEWGRSLADQIMKKLREKGYDKTSKDLQPASPIG